MKTLKDTDRARSLYGPFIVSVTLAKLALMGLFSSDYQDGLFLPFVSSFVENGGNAYQRFFESGIRNAFPYPTAMLLIESAGYVLARPFLSGNIFLVNALFKLPSLIMDIVGLNVLIRFFPEKRRYIAVFYYASPIVLYSVYMHGQLDLIPMVMLAIALSFLVSKRKTAERHAWGGIFCVLALLCKLHILAVMPILFLYLQKRDGMAKTLIFSSGVVLGTAAGIMPVWSEGFSEGVLFNFEQGVLTRVAFGFANLEIYIPVAALFFVYLLSFRTSYMNRELFLNLCGIAFSLLLAFCPPMPGWYVWIVPFMALFFASTMEEKYKNMAVYTALNVFYLLYFVFFHQRDGMADLYFLGRNLSFLKADSPELLNGTFTALFVLLIYLSVSMYRLGVASNSFYKRKDMPFTIGIAGDSGAGKSTMIDVIEKGLGASDLLYMEGDGDHKWERNDGMWEKYTALDPKANHLYRQAEDLDGLRKGSAVRRTDYDHGTGRFTPPRRIRPRKYAVLCGLHALYLPQTRKNLDLKIYMDTDEELRRHWKIVRDTEKRGHTKEEVLRSIEERMPDAEKYIYPQKEFADMAVRYYARNLADCTERRKEPDISIDLTVDTAVNLEPLVSELDRAGVDIAHRYSDDLKSQNINVNLDDAGAADVSVEDIAERVIPQLEEITKAGLDDMKISTKDGIMVLFILLLVSHKMQEAP